MKYKKLFLKYKELFYLDCKIIKEKKMQNKFILSLLVILFFSMKSVQAGCGSCPGDVSVIKKQIKNNR